MGHIAPHTNIPMGATACILGCVAQFPSGFGVLVIEPFLYKVFGSMILSFFKRMLLYTQSSCEIFEKGCKLGELFGQWLSLRAFIIKLNVSSI